MAELNCYNRGCGAKYFGEDNSEVACHHHPGVPIFHEGLKGWSCCSKRTTNFSDFLSFPGCTVGPHSPIKPELPQTTSESANDFPAPTLQTKPSPTTQLIIQEGPKLTPAARPVEEEPLVPLKVTVDQALKDALQVQGEVNTSTITDPAADSESQKNIKCVNNGCKCIITDNIIDNSECYFHPGAAIFHEGLKYWSCCNKKTTEFKNFLEQVGCATGSHKWSNEQNSALNVVKIRHDYFQRGRLIVVSFYGKMCKYNLSLVTAASTVLNVDLEFQNKIKSIHQFQLYSTISLTESFVTYMKTKVEITLIKDPATMWLQLEYKQPPIKDKTKKEETNKEITEELSD